MALNDGRILSWSSDNTLRLWDGQSGQCLKVLEGHSNSVLGALALNDGRILSWSWDKTLRLWDGQSGQCLKVLEGHSISVDGALALNDGRILSWSEDNTLRLWDGQSGQCLEVVTEADAPRLHPEWLHAWAKVKRPQCVFHNFYGRSRLRSSSLHHQTISHPLAAWQADSETDPHCLSPDGTLVTTQANGQVCFLKLHHGNRRISLAEAEVLLAREMKKAE